jgi:hypothetical protein
MYRDGSTSSNCLFYSSYRSLNGPVVHQTFWNLLQFPELSNITLNQIIHAISLARCLQHDIELPQPLDDSAERSGAPAFLPLAISDFLAESLGIPVQYVKDLWTVIKDDVWEAPSTEEGSKLNEECFRRYGWKRELSKVFLSIISPVLIYLASITLYPPHPHCTNSDCMRTQPLKKEESRQAVIYTIQGARRAWSVHLYCPGLYF